MSPLCCASVDMTAIFDNPVNYFYAVVKKLYSKTELEKYSTACVIDN